MGLPIKTERGISAFRGKSPQKEVIPLQVSKFNLENLREVEKN